MNRRGFLKRFGAALAGVVLAPHLGSGYAPIESVQSTEEAKIAFVKKLIDNAIETHDRLFKEALFADVNTPGRANSLVGFSEVLRG